jgi:hypothetical protein
MFVKYRDKLYTIDTIIDPAEAHAKLELMCKIRETGESPADDAQAEPAENEPAGGTEL